MSDDLLRQARDGTQHARNVLRGDPTRPGVRPPVSQTALTEQYDEIVPEEEPEGTEWVEVDPPTDEVTRVALPGGPTLPILEPTAGQARPKRDTDVSNPSQSGRNAEALWALSFTVDKLIAHSEALAAWRLADPRVGELAASHDGLERQQLILEQSVSDLWGRHLRHVEVTQADRSRLDTVDAAVVQLQDRRWIGGLTLALVAALVVFAACAALHWVLS